MAMSSARFSLRHWATSMPSGIADQALSAVFDRVST
jgi:hypothetical protein